MGIKQRYNPITNELNLVDEHAGTATVVVGTAENDLVEWDVASASYVPVDVATVDAIQFDVAAAETLTAEGKFGWDATNNTMSFGVTDGIIQVGQEVHDYYHNLSGVQLVNGDVVSTYGASGNREAVTLCDATDKTLSEAVLGMVTVPTINNGAVGRITLHGPVRELDTDTLTEGLAVYVDLANPGKLVQTEATPPDYLVYVGVCTVKSATVGVIHVNPRLVNSRTEQILQEPTGFDDPGSVVINYDSTARTITLTGSWNAYWQAELVSVLTTGWVSDAHAVTLDETYFLVYNGAAFVWKTSSDPFYFYDLLIARVTHGTIYKFGMRECHGLMQWQSHEIFHDTTGAFKESGGTLGDYTLASTTAADRRPTVSESVLHDEDVESTITAFAAAAYSQCFLSSTDTINFTLAAADIVPLSTARPYWNEFSGGTWGQTLMSNNYHSNLWVLQIPTTADAGSLPYRTIFLQGQSEYAALVNAQAETTADINLGELAGLAPEMVFIAKIIIKYTAADWQVVQVDALTGTRLTQVSSPTGLYLSSVETDATLTGIGTVGDPLIVAIPSITTVTQAATDTLIAAEVTNSVINNYGQAAENTQTLPTAAANMNFIAVVGTSGTGAFHIKAGPTDKIYLDGTALDDGDKASLATPAVGDSIVFFSFQTGASTYDWIAQVITGTWTDGGA